MKTKSIEYCYPTSENAERFGLNGGGYCVQVIETEPTRQPPQAVAGFKTEDEARAHAATMDLPFDALYLRFHPKTDPDVVLKSGRVIRHTPLDKGAQQATPTTGPAEMTESEWAEYCEINVNGKRPNARAVQVGKTADLFGEDNNGAEFFGDYRVKA